MSIPIWDSETIERVVSLRNSGLQFPDIAARLYTAGKPLTEDIVRGIYRRHAGKVREPYADIQDSVGPSNDTIAEKRELPPRKPREDVVNVRFAAAGEERIFAVASDIHIGSKTHIEEAFVDFVHHAYEQGARLILGPGDILDGVYRHSRWEQTHHGFQEQAQKAAEVFPRFPGLEYWMIAGNHDETFEAESGINVCSSLEAMFQGHGRNDFHMLGHRGAYVNLRAEGDQRGLIVELWHPRGNGAYALSYKQQRHIEAYAPGRKPDVMLNGHWHQQCYFTQRGVHVLSCGTFQGGHSPFGRSLGTTPAIGGWIVKYAQTPGGTVRSFSPTWRAYYEDETVREIAV
jgi:predicted phosphodiesterase